MSDQVEYLTSNMASYHFDRDKHFNEVNPGIGYEEKIENLRKMLGIYYNSYRNPSAYALLVYTPLTLGDLSFGGFGGLVSGYYKTPVPAAGLLMSYDKGDYGVKLTFLPPASMNGHKTEGFAGLQLKKLLKD